MIPLLIICQFSIGTFMIFLWHVICWLLMPLYGFQNICRVILAPNDDLAPFDPRTQILRVNVELSVHYRGQKNFSKKCPKVTFRLGKKILLGFLKQLILDQWW